MAENDTTKQLSNADVRSLEARITKVEEVILARFNDTRPFDHQVMARLNEIAAAVTAMQEQITGLQKEQTAMRDALEEFRDQTHENFRKMIQRQELLNNDNLEIRAEHRQLEKRVSRLEEKAA